MALLVWLSMFLTYPIPEMNSFWRHAMMESDYSAWNQDRYDVVSLKMPFLTLLSVAGSILSKNILLLL